jgi:hypothetical protein
MIEQFQLHEWGHCHPGKLYCYSEIMACNWLPNLSMYSLAVIRPWRVIFGPTEYCTTILLPKSSQNLPRLSEPNQAFRIAGFLRCSPNVNSSWCREQR